MQKLLDTDSNIKYIVAFPELGNYAYPIYNMLNKLIDKKIAKVIMPEKITTKTMEYGQNSSPDFVCLPFKYNMGNFIESLEKGANFLIQAGGGCRYGYYAEVQEQILKDMGYKFNFVSLLEPEGLDVVKLYKKFKILNANLTFSKFIYIFLVAIRAIWFLDDIETYIRDNYTFEINKGEFDKLNLELLTELKDLKGMHELNLLKKRYLKRVQNIKLKNPEKSDLKVGIVGELYTSMEPASSFFLEKELSKLNVKVRRYTTVTYLLFKKSASQKKLIKKASKYISNALGADGTESVAHTLELIEQGYDGIIHIKPFGCIPEINAMPILQKISAEKDIPIMYLTFDMQTSITGLKTRIEAFYDMLKMKKEHKLNSKTTVILKDEIFNTKNETEKNGEYSLQHNV